MIIETYAGEEGEIIGESRECPFCGGDGMTMEIQAPKRREAYVMCSHCGATGTRCSSIMTKQGDWEDTMEELIQEAIDFWNGKKR